MDTELYKLTCELCEESYVNHVDLGTTEYLARVVNYKGMAVHILAIAGTNEWQDWIKNIDLRSRNGIKKDAYDAAHEIHAVFKPMRGVQLIVTGHSRGGAAAIAYKKLFGADYCIAFCPARCLRYTINRYMENTTIFMDPDDIVPKLGFLNFGHPLCHWVYLPDDFPGLEISNHFIDNINKFLKKE